MLIAMHSLMRAIAWIPLINAARGNLVTFNAKFDSVDAWLVFAFLLSLWGFNYERKKNCCVCSHSYRETHWVLVTLSQLKHKTEDWSTDWFSFTVTGRLISTPFSIGLALSVRWSSDLVPFITGVSDPLLKGIQVTQYPSIRHFVRAAAALGCEEYLVARHEQQI